MSERDEHDGPPTGGTTRRTWTGDVLHTEGTPRGADRTAARNVVDLACLGALALSILTLVLGVADAAGLSLGASLGLLWPGLAVAVSAGLVWVRRSRRE